MRSPMGSVCRLRFGAAVAAALLLLPLVVAAPPTATAAEELVAFADTGYRGGTIIVRTSERRLYLVLGDGRALRYPVGVGQRGKQWTGHSRIVRKMLQPDWAPPPEVKRDNPGIPDFIPGGTPANPLGPAALILAGGEYAIHGTNRPRSVGGFVSYGCIRMYNGDIMRLFERVGVGTRVVVLP